MKKITAAVSISLLVILAMLPLTGASAQPVQQGWVQQVSGTAERLESVHALDANTAWVCGWSGTILKTADGGTTWNPQDSKTTTLDLYDIHAVDTNVAWAVGSNGYIVTTTDGGTNWVQTGGVLPQPSVNLRGVYAADQNNAWVVGHNDQIYKTINGGANWTDASVATGEDLVKVDCTDMNHGWTVGNDGALVATTNGTTWTAQNPDTNQKIRGVSAIDQNNAWICGFRGIIRKTADAGATWVPQSSPTEEILNSISAVDTTTAWAVGYDDGEDTGIICKTQDGGTNWFTQTGGVRELFGVSAVDTNTAWAVGDEGLIIKTEDGGESMSTWYLAEGSTNGGFETFVLMQNAGTEDALVNLTYMTPTGDIEGPQNLPLPAQSRMTIDVSTSVPQEWSVSTYITSDKPIIAERSMYWSNSWGVRVGGHDSIGTTHPGFTWYLAEGCTNGGFETWVLVQNPGDNTANVTLTYQTDAGAQAPVNLTLPPKSRDTVNVADTVADTWEVSTTVVSDQPVIAERAMYWNSRIGGHDSIGAMYPSADWYLAEGCTNGGFETWVLVQNPGETVASLGVIYMTPGGAVAGDPVTLQPKSRHTIKVSDKVPDEWSVSTQITSDEPIIAERAVYWNNRVGGHDSIGTTQPGDVWYLAEGSTAGGFETWVLLQNAGANKATATITYMTETGAVAGPVIELDPDTRQTVNVADIVPNTWSVSTLVTSDEPINVERAMYWGNRIGGHDSIGFQPL